MKENDKDLHTRNTETFITCSNTATTAMSTRIQSTEVNQVGTGRSCKTWTAAARIGESIWITGPIVLTRK